MYVQVEISMGLNEKPQQRTQTSLYHCTRVDLNYPLNDSGIGRLEMRLLNGEEVEHQFTFANTNVAVLNEMGNVIYRISG